MNPDKAGRPGGRPAVFWMETTNSLFMRIAGMELLSYLCTRKTQTANIYETFHDEITGRGCRHADNSRCDGHGDARG